MDLILRNARIAGEEAAPPRDIGVIGGRIAAIEPDLAAEGETIHLEGRLVLPGFIETHIHLDKSCILDRCESEHGRQAQNMKRVSDVKHTFTVEDVRRRAARTLEKCLVNGTTRMRTHVEVDPRVGLRGLEGVMSLIDDYAWAIDIQLCVFPQEGLTDNPGTDELLVEALRRGADVVGAAPGYDSDHAGQIHRIFDLAREFDVDVDMHLDFGNTADEMDIHLVADLTEQYGWGGRVTVGHMTKLSVLSPMRLAEIARRLGNIGVAVTVLPATDLFLMGRHQDHAVIRGVTPVHEMLLHGVNCSLSSNNVLNPFTPFGDCSLLRMANLYANTCQVSRDEDLAACFDMVARRSAELMRLENYGIAVGNPADLVVLDCASRTAAVAELAQPILAFKRGRRTLTRPVPTLHHPAP